MSNSAKTPPSNRNASRFKQWLHHTVARQGLGVQYRIRGNVLHLLCRQTPCPDRAELLRWLLPTLQNTDFSTLLPADGPPFYQVRLYGCEPGDKRPRWTTTIYLNQLERHLEQIQTAIPALAGSVPDHLLDHLPDHLPDQPPLPTVKVSALALSNAALAKRGEEMAIACYLSDTLHELGVAVRVSAKAIPYVSLAAVQQEGPTMPLTSKRLWVACEAAYSPDPLLLSEPITQKLRELEVEGFHDAVILFQVAGEAKPDWALRVDLTPPGEMLRDWARWGDLEAIQRLLNQDLAALQLHLTTATLNATTLHLCCGSLLPSASPNPVLEHHKRIKAEIGLLLEAIAPQGIHAATIYGQLPQQDAPLWVEWLDLPAAQHPALSESALTLAKQGDWGAIAFLLHRLLNANLDDYLTTGGIRLQLLPKQDLLHIMSEASSCPERKRVASALCRFLRQLELPGIAGIRIYGRRAGQKKPLWSYGTDFAARSRLVPEVTPEFAATDAYVTDLLPQPGEAILRPDLTPEDLHNVWRRWQQRWRQGTQRLLLGSQLFSPLPEAEAEHALPGEGHRAYGKKIALVWGTAGLLLLLQTNWMIGQVLRSQATAAKDKPQPVAVASPTVSPAVPLPSPTVALKRSPTDTGAFNNSGFIQTDETDETEPPAPTASPTAQATAQTTGLPYAPRSQTAALITAEILAEGSPLPSFNSQQLNEKLQLYYRFVEKSGPPDVLVVGSSRALRGIDPLALQAALSELGYANAKVFNFGINGATAQVVNLLVQHILTPDQMPRLILWADGARAFNSGTVDVTYNGIVTSEAYQQLLAGTLPIPHQPAQPLETPTSTSLNRTLTGSYQAIDRWFSQQLGRVTGRQTDRDQLKYALQQGVTRFFPAGRSEPSPPVNAPSGEPLLKSLAAGQSLPDETGFLSLAAQFNPATYYQKYARVLGVYDSDYEDFRINGSQDAALRSLLKFTQASQIPVVFVNLPLTEDYLDPVRLEYEQEFRDYMIQMALSHSGFVFRDLSEQWTTQYSYFSDPSHLNRYGAYAVSINLAQDAKIPWRRAGQIPPNPPQTTSQTKREDTAREQG